MEGARREPQDEASGIVRALAVRVGLFDVVRVIPKDPDTFSAHNACWIFDFRSVLQTSQARKCLLHSPE